MQIIPSPRRVMPGNGVLRLGQEITVSCSDTALSAVTGRSHHAGRTAGAWRGLSLDVARRFFPPGQIRRIVDLLALYKLNVLHLHLTDDEAWRIEAGGPAGAREPDGTFYTGSELRDLVRYAAEGFVAVVPEIDSPGHAAALVELRPDLRSGRNLVSYKRLSGRPRYGRLGVNVVRIRS